VPFINEVLEHNRAIISETRSLAGNGRVTRFRFDPEEVVEILKQRIIGQPMMHGSLSEMLHLVKADFGSTERPLAVFLFVGSTGVGKTETVRVLAEAILGSPDGLCRIDMNTLAQEHYAAAITGAPPGYVGSKENHTLFDFDKVAGSYSKPGIVLFDEIEKASQSVARALLNVLDSGMLELSAGTKQVSFKNSLIFMTSNEGARALDSYRRSFERGWRKWLKLGPSKNHERQILQQALQRKFDLEFINRIDQIVIFDELDTCWLDQLLTAELAKLNKRLAKHQVSVWLDDVARRFLLDGHDKRFGARHLGRKLRCHLEPALARMFNAHPDCGSFKVTCRDGKLSVVINP